MDRQYGSLRCRDKGRRAALLAAAAQGSTLCGIDTVEVEKDTQTTLHVFFFPVVPNGLDQHPELFAITGGERVNHIQMLNAIQVGGADPHVDVTVSVAGDFSIYTLTIQSAALDPVFASAPFSFKTGCPSPFDCPAQPSCAETSETDPAIDYYAKDYLGFRRALLDWVSVRYPQWLERSEADLGIALLDVLAYAADQLSDYQDRVANEMYLATARQRMSVKRHSALIDYTMHEGANAHAFLSFRVKLDGSLPVRTPITTVADPDVDAIIFETDEPASLYSDLNQLSLYTWSNADCCLPVGATDVYLLGWHSNLQTGNYLLFAEALSPITKRPEDADRTRRQIVKLTSVEQVTDPLAAKPLTHITWSTRDALKQVFCISTTCEDGSSLTDVTIACGNIVPASHGKTCLQTVNTPPLPPADPTLCKPFPKLIPTPFQIEIDNVPLTFTTITGNPRDGQSTIRLDIVQTGPWHERRTLVESDEFAQDFVVDVNAEGRAILRFGDGTYGRAVPGDATVNVTYRVGNGTAGNVGADTLTQIGDFAFVEAVTNPLSAWGGVDSESLDDVRRFAPQAFHDVKLRAVTARDYADAAEKVPGVQHASTHFRWTGSWHTVLVSIDPIGREEVTDELKQTVKAQLDAFRMAGYDVEVGSPVYVPLDIAINVCVKRDHFRADVLRALMDALSAGAHGFFDPDNFSFGEPLYLSRLYQAVERVEGVQSADVITFQRWGKTAIGELQRGMIEMSDIEIVRLDNDPSEQEHGRLVLNMLGGK